MEKFIKLLPDFMKINKQNLCYNDDDTMKNCNLFFHKIYQKKN